MNPVSYNYQTERPHIFTEDGQVMFLAIRDNAKRLFKQAGCARALELMGGVSGSQWMMMACMDRLIELGEIREITRPEMVWAQHRVFVAVEKEA